LPSPYRLGLCIIDTDTRHRVLNAATRQWRFEHVTPELCSNGSLFHVKFQLDQNNVSRQRGENSKKLTSEQLTAKSADHTENNPAGKTHILNGIILTAVFESSGVRSRSFAVNSQTKR